MAVSSSKESVQDERLLYNYARPPFLYDMGLPYIQIEIPMHLCLCVKGRFYFVSVPYVAQSLMPGLSRVAWWEIPQIKQWSIFNKTRALKANGTVD